MKKTFETARAIFQQHYGVLRMSEAHRLGISSATIVEMAAAGLLIRESRGIYRLVSTPPFANPDLVTVALRIPHGVICLISALHFYQLTTQIPQQVYVALPKDRTKAPRITYPPLHIITLGARTYSAGIEVHTLDNVPVKFYNREKTITDSFKFRNIVGHDVALEGLKTYFLDEKPRIRELIKYARLNRVEKIISPYIQLYQ